MSPEFEAEPGNRAYGSSVPERAATLKELVRRDALGQRREFTAKSVAARLGADKFRVIDYLAELVKSGELRSRAAISPNKQRMDVVYAPARGRERSAS